MKNGILKDKMTTEYFESYSSTHKIYLNHDSIGSDKPIGDLIFSNEDVRRFMLKDVIDAFNGRLLENIGVLV